MRIDKLLAHSGYGTRKQVRQFIKKGFVKVDDEIVTNHGFHVDPKESTVTVKGEIVHYEKFVYLMLNKPAGYISATYDREHLTVLDLVPSKYQHYNLAPVGRLDIDTEGFILLTNDGKLNHFITSPKQSIWKTYEAVISGTITNEDIDLFKRGIILDDGYKTQPAKLNVLQSEESSSLLRISITEGKFHQVKRMFRAIDREVIYLKRTKIGELKLDERLELGKVRPLNKKEMEWIDRIKEGE